MIRKNLFIYILIFLAACSSNNNTVSNINKPEPGLFSKDASKGINITELFEPKSDVTNVNVNGYLWRASLENKPGSGFVVFLTVSLLLEHAVKKITI